jgi:hypothetical protein
MSPFLDSPTIRPLYDVHDGGPPVGFRCMIFVSEAHAVEPSNGKRNRATTACDTNCARVTRTLAGMRAHQRIVHGIKQQQEFQFERIEAAEDQQNR